MYRYYNQYEIIKILINLRLNWDLKITLIVICNITFVLIALNNLFKIRVLINDLQVIYFNCASKNFFVLNCYKNST